MSDRIEANLFIRLVSARCERGSMIVSTNKAVRDWPDVFAGDEILITAILDRLPHHVHVVHIDGAAIACGNSTRSSLRSRSQAPSPNALDAHPPKRITSVREFW